MTWGIALDPELPIYTPLHHHISDPWIPPLFLVMSSLSYFLYEHCFHITLLVIPCVLRTKAAMGVPRHFKVTQGFPELPTMTANGRVQRGHGLSFDASPPNVPLSSIWTDGGLEGLEGLEWTEESSEGAIYVDFRLRKHT